MKKTIRELILLLLIYLLGISIGRISPIPSSLASMGILFLGLQTKFIKEEYLSVITPLLLAHIALFFIAPAIGIIKSLELLQGSVLQIVLVLILSNILVMGITGWTVQKLLKRRNDAIHR